MKKKLLLGAGGLAVLVASGLAAFTLVAANTVHVDTEVMRLKFYTSLEELVADSSLVVAVEVSKSGSEVNQDSDGRSGPSTVVSQVTVLEILGAPAALPLVANSGPEVGDVLDFYQFGVPGALLDGEPVLQQDGTYLLFLRPTGMSGSDENDFLATGGNSGVYELTGPATFGDLSEPAHFVQDYPVEGDKLPAEISKTQLAALLR